MSNVYSERQVSVYTVLMVISAMRKKLGVEATLEFIENYAKSIESACPEIKEAVTDELFSRGLNGLYETITNEQ